MSTSRARVAAATRHRLGGRPPKLLPEQQEAVVAAVLSGQHTAADMARRFRVSDATISRLLAAQRASAAEPVMASAPVEGIATAIDDTERVAGVLPLSALDEWIAIVGTSGSGKTYAAKGLLEPVMRAGGRVCVVDPLGVWWGLGRSADGGTSPFPVVVFGGEHADVPLAPTMATALGRLVGTGRLACVVDLSGLGTAAARRRFMTLFTSALYESNTEPLHLVLDEADLWAPQRVPPDGSELLGRVEEIVRRGRVRGFVPWLITQRPAVLHKDVLSQADILVAMKLTASQDRGAVGDWIEGQADRVAGRRILAALPRLRRGEGWVWAPSHGVLAPAHFPRIQTLDTSAAPRRPLRAETGAETPLAPPDLPALQAPLAALVEAASSSEERGHGSVAVLSLKVRQLETDLAAARAEVATLESELAVLRLGAGDRSARANVETPETRGLNSQS
jgi:uncharacterized protein